MDGQHFDEFVKTLAAQTSRRGALKALLAVTLGGGLGLGRLVRADAARCAPGKKCKADTPKAERCEDAGLVCENGQFACPTVANATASFTNGACQYTCQAGFADCDGDILSNGCEVYTNADMLNCGGCAGSGGIACDDYLECCNGTCTDQSAYRYDPANCGECGNACASGSACCDGQCIDVQNDDANCGECQRQCAQSDAYNEVCISGSCEPVCGDDGVCPGACYYVCHECGEDSGCADYHEFCCPGGNPEACLGPNHCPPDTQRFIGLR